MDQMVTEQAIFSCLSLLYQNESPKMCSTPGLDLRKKPWGQLASKFLDLVAKTFRPFGPKTFT